ncbi:MAG: glyoxylate carboligase [Treponema sp.]|jgi:tartronate-semialdehyde synthase|nr:glyoxylate carboligase [Treponema sp.]
MVAADVVVKILVKEGITDAFGIPGAGINAVYKYLNEAPIKHYLMRHEEAAVHAADAYYRASGKPALAICTSGPGATNFVTGLYTAWQDSIPLIAITGQANSPLLGKGAFQCVDIAEIVKTVSKKSYCVTDASKIPEVFREAFELTRSGRPGPVLIDLPLDIQLKEIDFSIDSYTPSKPAAPKPDKALIEKAVKMLAAAENPVIIMGGGVILSGAEQALVEFAEYTGIPVIITYMAKGGIPEAHPLYAGQVGIQVGAASSGNEVFLGADVVLGIGCRFTDRHTGAVAVYQGGRKFIHIDIDPNEIGKIVKTELGITADAADALPLLLEAAQASGFVRKAPPAAPFAELRKKFRHMPDPGKKVIDPREVYELINRHFNDDTIFTTGCGLNQIWSGQYQIINKPRKYLPSGGAGTLGYDIPGAIGASVATGGGKAVCVMGDFGYTFLVEEVAVAANYNLPVTVLILNNSYLSLIRQNQKYAYNYEYQVRMPENKSGLIDYVKVSEGLGAQAERVSTYAELEEALDRAAAAKGTYVVEILVEDNTDCDMGNDIAHIRHFQ